MGEGGAGRWLGSGRPDTAGAASLCWFWKYSLPGSSASMGLSGVGVDSDMHQRLERTKRGSGEQVWLWAPSPGAVMGALCPMWMAHHCQVHPVSKDKSKLALAEGWPKGQGSPGGLRGATTESCGWVSALPLLMLLSW